MSVPCICLKPSPFPLSPFAYPFSPPSLQGHHPREVVQAEHTSRAAEKEKLQPQRKKEEKGPHSSAKEQGHHPKGKEQGNQEPQLPSIKATQTQMVITLLKLSNLSHSQRPEEEALRLEQSAVSGITEESLNNEMNGSHRQVPQLVSVKSSMMKKKLDLGSKVGNKHSPLLGCIKYTQSFTHQGQGTLHPWEYPSMSKSLLSGTWSLKMTIPLSEDVKGELFLAVKGLGISTWLHKFAIAANGALVAEFEQQDISTIEEKVKFVQFLLGDMDNISSKHPIPLEDSI
ncbi:hypothetical protein BJV74DRAFT_800205 [Russula compacta]|nr:hypothetical protein BJV74DRAFT_800205 [Russula compacta]